MAVFLDISSAFDTITPECIEQGLRRHKVDENVTKWYLSYIRERIVEIENSGDKVRKKTGIGFPQGGVCSASFWILAFNPAINIINKYKIHGNGFADDCAAVLGGIRIPSLMKKMQQMLNELANWGRSCGLRFNPTKSAAVFFTRRKKNRVAI